MRLCRAAVATTLALATLFQSPATAAQTLYKSKHFDLKSPFAAGKTAIFAKKIEKAFLLIRQMLSSPKDKKGARPKLIVLANEQSFFQQGTRDRLGTTSCAGYFDEKTSRIVTWRRPRDADTLAILVHELSHLLLRRRIASVPLWLNEGIAEYFSGVTVVFGKPRAGKMLPGHAATFDSAWANGTLFPLGEFLKRTEYPSIHTDIFYAQSWALVFYLWEGKQGKFQTKFKSYLKGIEEGKDSVGQFRILFGDLAKFQRDWIKEMRKQAKSRTKGTRSIPTL